MKVVILFLAAALGSASPVATQNSIQARNGQNACDCAEPGEVSALGPDYKICPDGYEKVYLPGIAPKCEQIGCSYGEHKAKCSDNKPATTATAKPQDTPPTAVDKPAATAIAPEEQNACDCARPYDTDPFWDGGMKCPDGYQQNSRALHYVPDYCTQIGCSYREYEAKCDAKAQDATPSTAVDKPAATATAKPQDTPSTAVDKRAATAIAPEEQNACDCARPYDTDPFWDGGMKCPDGYQQNSRALHYVPHYCTQIGCSAGEHKAKCSNTEKAYHIATVVPDKGE